MHSLSPFFYVETKFGPLEKKLKTTGINENEIFSEEQLGTPFMTTTGIKKFWKN